ncbi:MAG: site-specific DNA-methyltransferase [Colwellia sp.]|nr:site-specific DNA-methyltransferase [Colwellia sp.]
MQSYYTSNGITIYNGECLEVMSELDCKFDLILTDLPYGTTDVDWDKIIPFEPLWVQYKRLIAKNRAIVLFSSQPFTSKLVMSNEKWFKYEWIWDKVTARGHLASKVRPLKQHENLCVFCEKSPLYNPQMIKRPKDRIENRQKGEYSRSDLFRGKKNEDYVNKPIYTHWYPKSIVTFSNATTKTFHPTQKPIALLQYIIRTYTNPGDIILDNTAGSFSTAVAAINEGRKFVGIEIGRNYCEIGKERIIKALFEMGNEGVNLEGNSKNYQIGMRL